MSAPLDWLVRLHGFLLVDKPEGMTSQDVITRLQRALIERSSRPGPAIRKRDLPKMGHGGTLDPFATGLLVLAVGDGTKLARYLIDAAKTYEAEVRFGERTASGDLTNEVVERTERRPASRAALEQAAAAFVGSPYLQTPPMYSAKKIDGKRLYEHARKGVEVERAAIACAIEELSVLSTVPAGESPPGGVLAARIRARASSGTFIRTLAEDWASKAGSLAHLVSLRRLASGPFEVGAALSIDALERLEDWTTSPAFLPFDSCLRRKLPSIEIDAEESRAILEGRKRDAFASIAVRLPDGLSRIAAYDSHGVRAILIRLEATREWDVERAFPVKGARSRA